MSDEATYEAGAYCRNCGYEGPVTAPVGEYIASQPCPLCACTLLQPTALRDWDRQQTE
jgi:hypothetical protein